jgi:hypothetical protein
MGTPWPGTDQYTTITVSGLYDNNTESPLFGVLGSPLPATGSPASASGIIVAGLDSNGNLQAISMTPNGFVNVNAMITNATVNGTLTNNNAAPIGDNLGVLVAEATAANPTYTQGFQVLLSTDLAGNLRTNSNLYANGFPLTVTNFGSPAVESLNVYVVNPVAVTQSGTWTVQQGTPPWSFVGTLTNNNAAPAATNVGVLGFLAETAYNTITYTTGDQVLAVTDLHGAVNQDLQAVAGVQLGATAVTAFGSAPAAVNVPAVNASLFAGTTALTTTVAGSPAVAGLNTYIINPITVSGTVTVTQGTSPWVVGGQYSNNTTAASAITNNLATLGFVATATPEAYTQGDQVLATTSLGGAVRIVPVDEANASSLSYYSDDSGFTNLITLPNATLVPLISIQSNSAAQIFLIRRVQGYGDGSQAKFVLIKNPQTLTGAAFTTTGIPTGSHIKRDVTATAVTIGTGTVVWSGMAASATIESIIPIYFMVAGTPGDTYTLAAQKFGTGTSKAFGEIQWSEQTAAL